jgi:uncharacterized membrane protein
MNLIDTIPQQTRSTPCTNFPQNDRTALMSLEAKATAVIFSRLDIPETYPANKSYTYVWGLSGDGSKVVGYSYDGERYEASAWDTRNGIQKLGFLKINSSLIKGSSSSALSICADGSKIVGQNTYGNESEAFVWDSNNGMQRLAFLRTNASVRSSSSALGICADGSKIVGRSFNGTYTEAFLWDSTVGMQRLGFLDAKAGGYLHSIAYGVCDRGNKVVGQSYNGTNAEAFLWDSTNGMQGLGFLGANVWGETRSDARAISADGSKIVGHSYNGKGEEAFIWDSTNGMQGLGFLGVNGSGKSYSYAKAISGDGSKVVGKSYNGSGDKAFIWDKVNGMRSLKKALNDDFGVDLAGWTLTEATGISCDGLTIVGNGIGPDGRLEAWILKIGSLKGKR